MVAKSSVTGLQVGWSNDYWYVWEHFGCWRKTYCKIVLSPEADWVIKEFKGMPLSKINRARIQAMLDEHNN